MLHVALLYLVGWVLEQHSSHHTYSPHSAHRATRKQLARKLFVNNTYLLNYGTRASYFFYFFSTLSFSRATQEA